MEELSFWNCENLSIETVNINQYHYVKKNTLWTHSYSPYFESKVPFWSDLSFNVNLGPSSCKPHLFSLRNSYLQHYSVLDMVKVINLIRCSLDLILGFKSVLHFTPSTGQTAMVPTINAATHSAENCLSLSQGPILPLGGEREKSRLASCLMLSWWISRMPGIEPTFLGLQSQHSAPPRPTKHITYL